MVMSGIGCVVGPTLAGYLYDVTQDYSYSFYLAGILFMSGSFSILAIPVLKSRRQQTQEKRNAVTPLESSRQGTAFPYSESHM
ncbi:monocarboxylate transporter 14-like [Lingula anatina]|uniref:Monocarboxylate transporter 14-like n=1 Tax=Lingula anatina TaxID=7574 RepID=A0A1S3J7K1_LINAN|nr:monocarboxylate transporter 14-like [Lingula anatina]|eukprot:XP_013405834.1 monocarboxylate transporter 14-like [Lingula anatina]